MTFRIGHSYDVHRVSDDPDRPLMLGGVHFDGPGLAGHSDADVVAHAVTDAILAAAGLGDIGQQFPDTDPAFKGADSIRLLATAAERARDAGWVVGNVDCTVVADRPKLAPRRQEMEARLSEAAGGQVTVKGRTSEGLGPVGRGEGIMSWAVALVRQQEVA